MYFSRLLFTLFGLIVLTVDAAKNCTWSLRTLHVVSSCPMTTEEKQMAEKIKKCEGLAGLQDCSESSLFKYHCVLNEAGDTFLEVCAPEVKILFGRCATFNTSNGRIETQFNRTCNTEERDPCPFKYNSGESYKFPTCYGFPDNFTTIEKETDIGNIDGCLEEKKRHATSIVIFVATFALYVLITMPFLVCHKRSLLSIRKCTESLSCSGYGFCKSEEKEPDKKGKTFTPEIKDYRARTNTSDEIFEYHHIYLDTPSPRKNFTMESEDEIATIDLRVRARI